MPQTKHSALKANRDRDLADAFASEIADYYKKLYDAEDDPEELGYLQAEEHERLAELERKEAVADAAAEKRELETHNTRMKQNASSAKYMAE